MEMNKNSDKTKITLPESQNYEYAYGLAFKLASEKLSNLIDLKEQCRRSNSVCEIAEGRQSVILSYLNRQYRISLPDINISLLGMPKEVELRDKILILHYFTQAKGTVCSNTPIAYQELQEGSAYYPSFFKRAIKPLIDYFGQNPERLLVAAKDLGGYNANYGDASVTIPAFSCVPVTLVTWKGDEEFPPDASILFDGTILDYLTVEDINILCQTIVWRLAKTSP
jgi:hypothetical protein